MQLVLLLVTILFGAALSQSDGNPHEWDRRRRCDRFDYDPPCGVCEGYGGIPYGDKNDQITLTTCSPVASADEIDPGTLKRPLWGKQWTLPIAYEVLIGPKNDPFCFVVFPGADSTGDLCYVPQTGTKLYDMKTNKAIKEKLNVANPVGNTTTTVLHQGPTMWIINHFPWWSLGLEQCVCVDIKEGGDSSNPDHIYPIAFNWIDNLEYIGREVLGIEYINIEAELDHWAYGPHHLWSYPETGQILRMWQPFNGLQVYPTGVNEGTVDESEFATIPPEKCRKGGAFFRTKCDDDGYPVKDKADINSKPIANSDHWRAKTKTPRHDYKGVDFTDMSQVLNHWINSSSKAKACELWDVEELQQLQALLYVARESQFDNIYQDTMDNRRLRNHILKDIKTSWGELNEIAAKDKDPMIKRIRRDGHCHEAVMWYVHHITEDMKLLLSNAKITLPLLSHHRHDCDGTDPMSAKGKICDAYREQVTCADCHSDVSRQTTK